MKKYRITIEARIYNIIGGIERESRHRPYDTFTFSEDDFQEGLTGLFGTVVAVCLGVVKHLEMLRERDAQR